MKTKKFIVDTALGVIFWFMIMMLYEVIFLDMTFKQSFVIRTGAIAINTLVSGLNGQFTDWYRKKVGFGGDKRLLTKYLFDTLGVVIFQIPVYVIILTASFGIQKITSGSWNASQFFKDIFWAMSFFPVLLFSVGWLYGLLLDKTRTLFGITD